MSTDAITMMMLSSGSSSNDNTVEEEATSDSSTNYLLRDSFLPRQILVDILAYLDLHSLVIFSGCSSLTKDIVLKQIPTDRWETIQICGGRPCTINDEQLSVFLHNINAVEKTRLLSLVGCPSLTGRGIEPLSGSTVLEDIDLRFRGTLPLKGRDGKRNGNSSIDTAFVTRILRTMLPPTVDEDRITPFALRRVVFRPTVLNPSNSSRFGYNHDIVQFWSYFQSCKSLAIQRKAKQCKQVTCDNSGEKSIGKCSKCCEYFCVGCDNERDDFVKCSSCRVPSRNDESIKCIVCNSSFCDACSMPPKCSICTTQKCQWCSNIYECGGCGKQSCANHGAECCAGCEKSYCDDCQDENIDFCIVCNEYYCYSNDCHERMH